MKLRVYCQNSSCRNKIYLNSQAQNRAQLARGWGLNFSIQCPKCGHTSRFNCNQVVAESIKENTAGGAALGGLIGMLGGPPGAIIGAFFGGLVGSSSDDKEQIKARRFNQSTAR
jgi:hypothetical protein